MRTHTIGLRTQAYVCARILMPRNPNLSFSVSSSLFLSYLMPLFGLFLCFLSFCSFVLFVCLFVFRTLDYGFLFVSCFDTMNVGLWIMSKVSRAFISTCICLLYELYLPLMNMYMQVYMPWFEMMNMICLMPMFLLWFDMYMFPPWME